VESAEYGDYMDHIQEFNFRLKQALEERGITLAYPARILRMLPGEGSTGTTPTTASSATP
jgi:hypothetical protein